MVEWRVYGCGSPSSSLFLQSSYEYVHRSTQIQVDFGNGALYQRCRHHKEISLAVDSIQHILLTHAHPDHYGDLPRLYVAWKWTPDFTPKQQIQLYATAETIEQLLKVFSEIRLEGTFEDAFELHAVELKTPFSIDDITITPVQSQHIEGSVGYRFQSPSNKTVSFTGDTGYFDQLPETHQNADLLISEASFEERNTPFHLDLSNIASMVKTINPDVALLVHLYPELEVLSADAISQKVKESTDGSFNGKIIPAYDGLAIMWNDSLNEWQMRSLF